ncbi:acyltransferase family protein [Pantoea dispersa]|uniref:acyltransferase family protein n=2 Tax=Pantoea dispersa TaxID=59814 RepID=UPI00092FD359|nr:acyltransferase [Pantoea dispersa]
MQGTKIINSKIQTLRAIAILMVIFQHYRNRLPSPEWYLHSFNYVNYWPAVDLFLAISGYLMAKSLTREIDSGLSRRQVFKNYFYHRAFRLIPCLLFWGIASIIIAYFLQPAWGVSPLKSFNTLYTSLLGYSNIHFYLCTRQAIDCDQMNAVTWSLSLEWQLYALIAIIMLSCKKKWYIPIFLTIITLSFLMPIKEMYYTSISWWLRPQSFFLGASIFFLCKKTTSIRQIWLVLSIFFLFTILLSAPKILPIKLMLPIIALSSVLILLCFLIENQKKPGESFISKLTGWIGDRSYSIYLCHLPALHITRESLNHMLIGTPYFENKIIYFFSFFIITTLSASFTYKQVEKRFIKIGRRLINQEGSEEKIHS